MIHILARSCRNGIRIPATATAGLRSAGEQNSWLGCGRPKPARYMRVSACGQGRYLQTAWHGSGEIHACERMRSADPGHAFATLAVLTPLIRAHPERQLRGTALRFDCWQQDSARESPARSTGTAQRTFHFDPRRRTGSRQPLSAGWASSPQQVQPGICLRAKSSTMRGWSGNMASIRRRTSSGLAECRLRFSCRYCRMLRAPRGWGIRPRLNTRQSSPLASACNGPD